MSKDLTDQNIAAENSLDSVDKQVEQIEVTDISAANDESYEKNSLKAAAKEGAVAQSPDINAKGDAPAVLLEASPTSSEDNTNVSASATINLADTANTVRDKSNPSATDADNHGSTQAEEGSSADFGAGADINAAATTDAVDVEAATPASKISKDKYSTLGFKRLGAEVEAAPTVSSRIFNLLSWLGVPLFTALTLLVVWAAVQGGRALWFPEELMQAELLKSVFEGNFIIPQLNGVEYSGTPPLYYWLLYGINYLLEFAGLGCNGDYARLLFIGSGISAILFVWSVLGLARFVARLDRRGVFATGAVLLSVFFVVGFFTYVRMDLFFAALIVCSQIFLFRALVREQAPLLMGLAFLCAGLAVLVKGPLGLIFPMVSAVLFSVWQGRPLRLLHKDFLLGFVLSLLPTVAWLGIIWSNGGVNFVIDLLKTQVIGKAIGNIEDSKLIWQYLVFLPLLWLPWSLLLPFIPWHRVLTKKSREALVESRNGNRQGLAFLFFAFAGGFAILSLISTRNPIYLLPLMAPMAVFTGRAALLLSPRRSMLVQRVFALFCFIGALAFAILPVYFTGDVPSALSWLDKLGLPHWAVELNGVFILAAVLLAATCLLLGTVSSRRAESTLLIMLLAVTCFSVPLALKTAPSLDNIFSSRLVSEDLKNYANEGYVPVSLKLPTGVFSYYSGQKIKECETWADLDKVLTVEPNIALVMSDSRWNNWNRSQGFAVVRKFWMVEREYVLLLRGNPKKRIEYNLPFGHGPAIPPKTNDAGNVEGAAGHINTGAGRNPLLQTEPGPVQLPSPDTTATDAAGGANSPSVESSIRGSNSASEPATPVINEHAQDISRNSETPEADSGMPGSRLNPHFGHGLALPSQTEQDRGTNEAATNVDSTGVTSNTAGEVDVPSDRVIHNPLLQTGSGPVRFPDGSSNTGSTGSNSADRNNGASSINSSADESSDESTSAPSGSSTGVTPLGVSEISSELSAVVTGASTAAPVAGVAPTMPTSRLNPHFGHGPALQSANSTPGGSATAAVAAEPFQQQAPPMFAKAEINKLLHWLGFNKAHNAALQTAPGPVFNPNAANIAIGSTESVVSDNTAGLRIPLTAPEVASSRSGSGVVHITEDGVILSE